MILGDEACSRSLGHESRALVIGIDAVIKEAPEDYLVPPTMRGHSKKAPAVNQEEDPHQNMALLDLDLGLSSVQNCEK